jgi:inhibitor of cysteine peptidase
MKTRTISLLLIVALVVPGAALAYRVVRVGRLANGKTIVLRPSDRLVVTLPGNATTGYSWSVLHLDKSVVKYVGQTYVPRSAPGKVGAGGKYVLRFRAVRDGTTKLKLGYLQEGNSNAVPAKTYVLHLTVKPPPPRV